MDMVDASPDWKGSGEKDCPKCLGRGVVPLDVGGWIGAGTQNCTCVFKRDLLANVRRVWPVLLSVESVESSPLLNLTKENVWVTASNLTLRRHLRYVAFRMGVSWDARVVADATLVSAWLATATGVRDPDVKHPTSEAQSYDSVEIPMTLRDLVCPYDLLIIRLGVKAAANKEMANVLAEALNERDMQGKPTWIVDDTYRPLAPGHKCYSPDVMAIVCDYRRIHLKSDTSEVPSVEYPARSVPQGVTSVAPQPAVQRAYGVKAVTLQGLQSQGPQPAQRPPVRPEVDMEDEFSPGALVRSAVNFVPPPEEINTDFGEVPTDMVTNGTPSWLGKKRTIKKNWRKS